MSALKELHHGTDRAVAIVAGTLMEIALTDALKIYLHHNKKITDELFKTTGAFGAFATKIHLGLLVGLYGANAHRDLVAVKDIRNAFAHSLEVRDFKTQRIRDWANNLKLCERYTVDIEHERKPGKHFSDKPLRDWPHWVYVKDRAVALKDPRERYIMTAQVFASGLITPNRTAMPPPLF